MNTTDKTHKMLIFQALDAVPSQLWYLLGIGSIVLSLTFQLAGKKNWSDFVGKWPPTFFAHRSLSQARASRPRRRRRRPERRSRSGLGPIHDVHDSRIVPNTNKQIHA